MKKHKYIIRFLVFWHFFISGFALLIYNTRITNSRLAGDLLYHEYLLYIEQNPVKEWLEGSGFNGYLIFISVIALASGVCLLVKKTWGRFLSITLGIILLPLGIFVFIDNFSRTHVMNPTLFERIIDYFRFMGASLGYIELVCIFYGIFAIICFTRNNVKSYLSKNRN